MAKKRNAKAAKLAIVPAIKPTPTVARGNGGIPAQSRGVRAVHSYCKCLADPESSPACRMPDSYVYPTGAVKLTEEFILSSDAQGDACTWISPSLIRNRYTTAITAGVAGATSYTAHPDYTELLAAYQYGRVVTYSVTVSYIGAAQTASGRLAVVSDSAADYVGAGAVLSSAFDDGHTNPAKDGAFVVARPRVQMPFEVLSTVGLGVPALDYTYIVAGGLPPSSPCLSIRVSKHVETIPKRGSLWRGAAAVEMYNPIAMTQAANMGGVGAVGSLTEKSKAVSLAQKAAAYAWDIIQPEAKALGQAALSYGAKEATGALLALL